jgi:hypothetical protein
VESNGGCGETPAHCVSRGADCEVACERSRFGGLTLLDGVWCCSGTTAEDPAWQWPFRRGAVCFCRLLINARLRCRFRRLRERECWWVPRLVEMRYAACIDIPIRLV